MGHWTTRLPLIGLSLLFLTDVYVVGDFEQPLSHCCNLGVKWGVENLQCAAFPAPVVGIRNEQQAICLSAVHICCLRKHRERQCELGKQSARADRECSVNRDLGGETHKDCCEGCKLGLVAGSMSMGCTFRAFQFGAPWDDAYRSCCQQTLPQVFPDSSFPNPRIPSTTSRTQIPPFLPPPPTPALPKFPIDEPNSIEDDEDLCARFPGELCAHVCVPTGGSSYRCECREGFQLLADGKSCQQATQYDRCSTDNPCSQKCTDTGLAVECSCHSGYQLASDEKTCTDVDECFIGADNCDVLLQICVNQPGSFACIDRKDSPNTGPRPAAQQPDVGSDGRACPRGFKFNAESRVCDDVNECDSQPPVCPAQTLCQNTIGSYTCARKPQLEECPLGFRFNSQIQTCIDIDECKENPATCPKTRPVCINLQGSYTCQSRNESSLLGPSVTCPAGYKFNTAQQTCEDVDECAERLDSCIHGMEMCINDLGRYHCEPLSADAASPSSGQRHHDVDDHHHTPGFSQCPPGYTYDEDEQVCIGQQIK